MKDTKNAPQMPEMLFNAYMSGVKRFLPPLSTTKYLKPATDALEAVTNQIGMVAINLSDSCFPKEFGAAFLYASKIGLNSTLYVLGRLDKNELLNSIEDTENYINSLSMELDDDEKDTLSQIMLGLTESINGLIQEREMLLKYEAETQAKKDSGMSDDEIIESEKDKIHKFMQHISENDVDDKDLDLKAGEHREEIVYDTPYGTVRKVTIRLPIAFEKKVTDGNVVGTIIGYYPEELKNGTNGNTKVIVKVESSKSDFNSINVDPIKGDVASPEPLDKSAKYFETTVGALKVVPNYS